MGRPRKYPLPDSPAPAPAPTPAPVVAVAAAPEPDEKPESFEGWEPEELVAYAFENPRVKAPPVMVEAVSNYCRDNGRADDDFGKSEARRAAAWLKRRTHPELHPGCQRITMIFPALKRRDGGVWHLKINERVYVGECTVWECEARTLKEMEYRYRLIEDERMDDTRASHPTFDLDTGSTLAERARAIQRA